MNEDERRAMQLEATRTAKVASPTPITLIAPPLPSPCHMAPPCRIVESTARTLDNHQLHAPHSHLSANA